MVEKMSIAEPNLDLVSSSNKKSSMIGFLTENQNIQIIAGIFILLCIAFYFHMKNKKIKSHIEELSQKIEDQEDKIQKLESTLSSLSVLTSLPSQFINMSEHIASLAHSIENLKNSSHKKSPKPKKSERHEVVKKEEIVHTKPIITIKNEPVREPAVKFSETEEVQNYQSEEDIEDFIAKELESEENA